MRKGKYSLSQRVFYSFRLGGLSKILVPCVLGQLVAAEAIQSFCWQPLVLGGVLSLLLLISIVFNNDLADEEVDLIKRRMHPNDSSPKTLTDDLLSRSLIRFFLGQVFFSLSSSLFY